MVAEPLSRDEAEERLRPLSGWSIRDGRVTRTYRLGTHVAAVALVVHIAQIQEELNHHSELTLGYSTVSLAVSTHDAGGAVTGLDIALAERVESVAGAHGAH